MAIKISVRYTPPELGKAITEAPRAARGPMTKAAAVYLVGDMRHGLKHYPIYKYVTRKRAYGKTFFSEKQRRFVMAMIRFGRIDPGVPHRTGRLQRGWRIIGSGVSVSIRNDEPHANYVMGLEQARLNKLVGWRIYTKVIEDNTNGMIRAANDELKRYYKKKGVVVK